jgi:hypothetical protein
MSRREPPDCGEAASADADTRPLRSFGAPIVDLVQPMPYPVVNTLRDDAFPKGALNYWKSVFLTELSDPAIDVMVDAFERVPSTMTGICLDHVHGAAIRVDATATAFPHRQEAHRVLVLAQRMRAETESNMAWARETSRCCSPI